MSCLICNELLHHMCGPCNISSHFHLHVMCCSHKCTCGLITYVSHINTIFPPRLLLNYQNHIRTFQCALPALGRAWAAVAAGPRELGRFGPPLRMNHLADLTCLPFSSSIEAYQEAFQAHLAHAGHLTPYQQAHLFMGGLPKHIRINVELHDPQDL